MKKTPKTDAQKAFDEKRLKKAKIKIQKRALKIVKELQEEIEICDFDFSRISIGPIGKVISFNQVDLEFAKRELKKPFVGDKIDDETSHFGFYKNLEK